MWRFHLCFTLAFFCFIGNTSADTQCTKDSDCLVNNSACVNKSCGCSPDYVFNGERTNCLKVSHGYGANCTDSIQCSASLLAGGMCSNGTCKCTEGYHYLKGQCWKTSGLGDSCEKDNNCYVSYDFEASVCNAQKKCECAEGYYQREYSSCRRISKNKGDPCGIFLDCKFPNAVCTRNRTCQVQTNDIEAEDESYNIIELCRKKRRIFNILTSISGLTKIGDKCKSDTDCPDNSQCYMQSICQCKTGYYTLDDFTCHPELGESCKSDKDCLGKNTMCRDGKYCACKEGFVTSYDSRYCDKISRNISWSCLRDEQCGFFGPGGKCISKKCHCSNSTHWVQDQLYCWISKKVGENCAIQEDCGGQNSNMVCNGNKCSCVSGTHASTSARNCNKDSKEVGQPCTENIDCMYSHGRCNTVLKKCTCEKGYLENKSTCSPGINATCKSNDDCFVKNTQCINNTCTCNGKDLIPSENLDKCLVIADTIGLQCSETIQCSKVQGLCLNNICNCDSGYVFYKSNSQCYLARSLGQRCTNNGNCTVPYSVCKSGRCACWYHQRGNRCTNGGTIELSSSLMLWLTLLVFFPSFLNYKY